MTFLYFPERIKLAPVSNAYKKMCIRDSINVGRMSIGLPCYVSATPNGILELLKRYQIETSGKKCVVDVYKRQGEVCLGYLLFYEGEAGGVVIFSFRYMCSVYLCLVLHQAQIDADVYKRQV